MNSRTITRAACAALLVTALPAAAAIPASSPTPAAQAAAAPVSGAVARFYESRRNAPIWFTAGPRSPAATQLVTILRRAHLDGLSSGPELADQAQAAIRQAQSGNPADLIRADRLLSNAWVRYVQALNWPATGIEYGDQWLAPRIPEPETILHNAAHARSLERHLRSVSHVNPIYAQLRDAAWNELQLSGNGPTVRRLLANLDRARALPASGRFVIVDIASARLHMYEDGQLQDSMKVIVGKPEYRTPLIASTIHYATFNPYWHVPQEMVRRIIAQNVLKQGMGYLRSRGYQVVTGYTDDARVVSPESVDWKAVAAGREQIWVRQLPGPGNSMGDMKFSFPNETGIYLHDTPDKSLFNEAQRTLSAGCIRLEDAPRFARWLLGREPTVAPGEAERHVRLPQGVPIYITYLTAQPNGNEIAFTHDVYGLDGPANSRVATLR